ncbi:hypothetical protein P8452_62547 [Trifolium repens]|nr:hypothetical protein P8452_62547 [Trifolium repens]
MFTPGLSFDLSASVAILSEALVFVDQSVDLGVQRDCFRRSAEICSFLIVVAASVSSFLFNPIAVVVLKDLNASNSVLASRGKALEMLGDIFQGAKTAYRRKNSLRHESESGDDASSSS